AKEVGEQLRFDGTARRRKGPNDETGDKEEPEPYMVSPHHACNGDRDQQRQDGRDDDVEGFVRTHYDCSISYLKRWACSLDQWHPRVCNQQTPDTDPKTRRDEAS